MVSCDLAWRDEGSSLPLGFVNTHGVESQDMVFSLVGSGVFYLLIENFLGGVQSTQTSLN